MSNTTIALRSSGATGNVPNALSLAYGEFALNYADGIIYYRTDSDTVGSILTTQPSGLDKEIQFNDLGSFGSSANLSFNKTTGLFSTSRIYVSANAQIVGNVTASKLISNNSIGDSGGELLLALPAANTTLSGLGITIDAFQNKIRFFEQGGTNRGAYIDLTEAAANVGTNLLTAGGGGGSGNNALQYRSSYTANGGQTVFAATYIPGYVDTFINGVKLTPGTDFTATNGTTITLSEGAVANDSVEIIGYVTVSTTLPDAIQRRYSYTANAAQTTFAAVYVAPYVDVYKNGVRLSPTANYIANNGTEIVLTAGAALADLIEIVGYSSYTATVAQADQLTTGRTIAMTGDVTWTSNSFNGAANVTGTSTLANTGVTAGTYTKVTVDAKGRVTTGNTLSYSDLPTYSGNLVFTGTGNRILGDFSNSTITNRVAFQTSTANGATRILTIPNGTGSVSAIAGLNSSDANNASWMQMAVGTTEAQLNSTISGTGTYLPMTFYTGGGERVRIDTSGNLGIGSISPTYRLSVKQSGNTSTASLGIASINSANDTFIGMGYDATSDTSRIFASFVSTGAFKPISFWTSDAERMRINAAGNIGIGTTSPGAKLDVNGSIVSRASGGEGGEISFNNPDNASVGLVMDVSATDNGRIFQTRNNSALQIGQLGGTGGQVIFYTAAAERMRIDSAGNLGVGATPSALSWPNGSTGGLQLQAGALLSAYNATTYLSNNWYYNAGEKYIGNGFATRYEQTTGKHTWYYAGNNTSGAGATVSWTQAMTLDAGGSLQINRASNADAMSFALATAGANRASISIANSTSDLIIKSEDLGGRNNGIQFWTGNPSAERMRIDTSGNLSSAGDQYRTRYYQTGSFIPGSTNWMRLCTLPATNQGQHVEFIFTIPGQHIQLKVKFSKTTAGALGGGGILEVEQLGSYSYWNYCPFDWRLRDEGTNSPSHIDIRFNSNAGETINYRINVLHSYCAGGASTQPTFPLTNLGSGTTGSYYVNMGDLLVGWSRQYFKLTGSKYMFHDSSMIISSGQNAPTA